MSTLSKSKRVWWGAAALVAAALLLFPTTALTVRATRSGALLWAVPVGIGSNFTLTWTHTVTLRPVSETYEIEPNGLIHLQEMVFDHFGPNLPSAPEGGTTWRHEPDRIVVTGYTERYERLNLGVAPITHDLRAETREWDMLAGAGPDRLVKVQVEREPWIFILLAEVRQWRSTRRLP